MANTLAQQPEQPIAYWRGRPVVLIRDSDDKDQLHGLWIGPVGITMETMLREFDMAFRETVAANPDEWTFDELHERLTRLDYQQIPFCHWREEYADLPRPEIVPGSVFLTTDGLRLLWDGVLWTDGQNNCFPGKKGLPVDRHSRPLEGRLEKPKEPADGK